MTCTSRAFVALVVAEVAMMFVSLWYFNSAIRSPVEDYIFLSIGTRHEGVVIPRGMMSCKEFPQPGVLSRCQTMLAGNEVEVVALNDGFSEPKCQLIVNGIESWCDISEGTDSWPMAAFTNSNLGLSSTQLEMIRNKYAVWNIREIEGVLGQWGPALIALSCAAGVWQASKRKLLGFAASVATLVGVFTILLYMATISLYSFYTLR